MTGFEVRTLGDMKTALGQQVKPLLTEAPEDHLYKPYLGEALDAGMAALFAQEMIMAIRYIYGQEPVKDDSIGLTYNGFISDTILRNLGVQLVDGSMPGYVCIIGAANNDDQAFEIARELQQKNILTLMCGNVNGDSMTKQLLRKGVQLGWDTRLVPLGPEVEHAIYALNWAARAGITFGGMKGGDFKRILKYSKDKVFAFAMVLGPLNDRIWTTGAGAINMGFPAIANTDIPTIHPTGVTIYEEVAKELDPKKIVEKCIEVRGLKITVSKPPIPVAFGPAFEGERIRKEDMHIEFGGQRTPAFEWLHTADLDKVEDGKVTIVGTDAEARYQKGGQMPLGIADRGCRPQDAEGLRAGARAQDPPLRQRSAGHLAHGPARPELAPRQHQGALKEGFVLRHFGDILTTQLKHKFNNIVDKVQVTLYVDDADVKAKLEEARKGLSRARCPAGDHDRRVRGHVLLLHPLPELRPEPCMRGLAGTPRSLRRLQLAGCQGGLRDRPERREPAGPEGRDPGRGQGALDRRGRICVQELAPGARILQRLQHHGRAHDLLRLLRVHRGHRARGERRDDREPRLHGHDADRHEVLDPRRHRGRRRADARASWASDGTS